MKKRLMSVVQLGFGVGILVFLIVRLQRTGRMGQVCLAVREAASNWPMLLAACAAVGGCLLVGAWRWSLLLRAQGLGLPFSRVTTLYLVGHFFSAFMLGATGGDVVKAYYVAMETRHRRTEVVSSILIDRLIGLLALVGLTAGVTLVRAQFFLRHRETRVAMLFNLGLLAAAAVGLAAVFRQDVFERWSWFRTLEQRTSLGGMLARAYRAFRLCLSHRGLLARTLALSLGNHLLMLVACWLIALSLRLPLGFGDVLTVFPMINAIACLPITPGGLGVREGAAVYMLGALDVGAGAAVTLSLLIYTCAMVWSLIGGLVYLTYSARRGRAVIPDAPDADTVV